MTRNLIVPGSASGFVKRCTEFELIGLSPLIVPVGAVDCHPVANNWVAIWVATFPSVK